MSRRHTRQRSSVSIKKRVSVPTSVDIEEDEIHDNALSAKEASLPTAGAVAAAAAAADGYFGLASPYHDDDAEGGRMQSMYSTDSASVDSHQRVTSPGLASSHTGRHLQSINVDEMTTRTELDLFEEEEEEETPDDQEGGGIASSPAVPPKSPKPQNPPLPPSKFVEAQSSTMLPYRARVKPSHAMASNYTSTTPTKTMSSETDLSRNGSMKGTKGLSLLAGNGGSSVVGSSSASSNSPSTSPNSIRTLTPKGSIKTPRGKRMSLSYVPSPSTSRFLPSASLMEGSSTPPVRETPPASSSSIFSGYFAPRSNDSQPGTPGPSSAPAAVLSASALARSSPENSLRPVRREDGDTVMTQHKDILSRIAEKERTILEIRETLEREEKQLKQLQTEWQASVQRELVAQAPDSTETAVAEPCSSSAPVSTADLETHGKEAVPEEIGKGVAAQNPANVASDGWKALSARLAGAGKQLNAFIDELAAPALEEEERRKVDAAATTTRKTERGLHQLPEEGEEEGAEQKDVLPPLPPAKGPSFTNRQQKRTSMFGSSFAALQKQVEAQFSPSANGTDVEEKSASTSKTSPSSGWGVSWQQKLKEARENASGLLAKAEARLGQALTMDELISLAPNDAKSPGVSKNSATASSSSSSSSPHPSSGGGGAFDFTGENDREKAALAELSWLNSLAGINMTGTTDRVTTAKSADVKDSSTSDPSSAHLNRSTSSSSRTSRRASSTSHLTSTTRASSSSSTTNAVGISPSTSPSNENGGNKRDSNGFFSMLSTAWGAEKMGLSEEQGRGESHTRRPSSGHSKTRMAAQLATGTSTRSSSDVARPNESQTNKRISALPAQDTKRKDDDDDDHHWRW